MGKLKLSQQCAYTSKARSKLGCTRRTTASRPRTEIPLLCSVLVRLHQIALTSLGLPSARKTWKDWSKSSGAHRGGLDLEQVSRGRKLQELGLLTLGKMLKLD